MPKAAYLNHQGKSKTIEDRFLCDIKFDAIHIIVMTWLILRHAVRICIRFLQVLDSERMRDISKNERLDVN